jgi:ribosomal protein S18 acetylase RimI-like enzyme
VGVDKLVIRTATQDDVDVAADLIVRTKRLNNEFDPMFAVAPDAQSRAEKYVAESVRAKDVLLLVATRGPKIVGVLRAEIRERLFYEPSVDGRITDFYILPEFRRKALGNDILSRAATELKKMGAQMITADVPSQNEIAVKFYNRRGFRVLQQVFAKRHQ